MYIQAEIFDNPIIFEVDASYRDDPTYTKDELNVLLYQFDEKHHTTAFDAFWAPIPRYTEDMPPGWHGDQCDKFFETATLCAAPRDWEPDDTRTVIRNHDDWMALWDRWRHTSRAVFYNGDLARVSITESFDVVAEFEREADGVREVRRQMIFRGDIDEVYHYLHSIGWTFDVIGWYSRDRWHDEISWDHAEPVEGSP